MSTPALEHTLANLIEAIAVDTGQDVVSVTDAQLTLPLEVAFGTDAGTLIVGAQAAGTQMRTGFEAPLSTIRMRVSAEVTS